MDLKKIEKSFASIIDAIGEDKNREGLINTPERVAQSYSEFFSGIDKDPKDMLQKTILTDKKDIVIEKNIDFYSMCEHHFLPFFGAVDIAYIPNNKIIGFGHIISALEVLAKRPQLQERLGYQLADALYEALQCEGVMVIVKAKHLCMTMRGSKKENSEIITTSCRGCFENDTLRRIEVINLLK
ncbi:GTP cyclohydrolase I FolE [Fusobacterium sp.]|uniref:GTP cyclohydrolase I FolE n=1 Tax=Fusobacterium sp. TaxID=68766 RepID=UPI000C715475|nr:GTP cyclohydrolase I FolE [Fusobacterium sp.]